MSHDPTVTAAIITVLEAGGVAVVGFVTTLRTTQRTIESGMQTTKAVLASADANVQSTERGERGHRLWERRTDLYVELIAFVSHRQQSRANKLKRAHWNQE